MPSSKHFVRSNIQRSASLVSRRKNSVFRVDASGSSLQATVVHSGGVASPVVAA